jgi:L-malate glycosyltransferase
MIVVVQAGKLVNSTIDHLVTPFSRLTYIKKVLVVCNHPGLKIEKVEYYCPPSFMATITLTSFTWQIILLIYLTIFRKPSLLVGINVFPHGLTALLTAHTMQKPAVIMPISGPWGFYSINRRLGVNIEEPLPAIGKFLLRILKNAEAIVTTGSFTKKFLVNHGIRQNKIFPIISPANRTKFFVTSIAKKYDLISVGRLSPEKHHDILMYVIKSVKEKYSNFTACIVGDGPCLAKLKELADELGIIENVTFAGRQQNVTDFYNSSRIFIHTSEREGFPSVILEAMLCGLPCILSSCGDITDIAKHEINALVIDRFDDTSAYTNAIFRLLEDKELCDRLSRHASETMSFLSDVEATKMWGNVISSVIENKSATQYDKNNPNHSEEATNKPESSRRDNHDY